MTCIVLYCICCQTLLKNTGCYGKTTVFLITDSQIKEESFLEDIDSLLNTGEVPNLFATDEKVEIMEVGLIIIIMHLWVNSPGLHLLRGTKNKW